MKRLNGIKVNNPVNLERPNPFKKSVLKASTKVSKIINSINELYFYFLNISIEGKYIKKSKKNESKPNNTLVFNKKITIFNPIWAQKKRDYKISLAGLVI